MCNTFLNFVVCSSNSLLMEKSRASICNKFKGGNLRSTSCLDGVQIKAFLRVAIHFYIVSDVKSLSNSRVMINITLYSEISIKTPFSHYKQYKPFS